MYSLGYTEDQIRTLKAAVLWKHSHTFYLLFLGLRGDWRLAGRLGVGMSTIIKVMLRYRRILSISKEFFRDRNILSISKQKHAFKSILYMFKEWIKLFIKKSHLQIFYYSEEYSFIGTFLFRYRRHSFDIEGILSISTEFFISKLVFYDRWHS